VTRKPPLTTRMHAAMAGERSAAPLEALRTAGKAAYDEALRADRVRDELVVAQLSRWETPPGAGSQLLAAWNGFVLQTLGEALLDADYAADRRTAGFLPAPTYDAALDCFTAVAEWIDRARQARVDPAHDLTAELDLPAPLPLALQEHLGEHPAAIVLALSSLRGPAELALHSLERTPVPAEHSNGVIALRQLVGRATTAAEYAASLHGSGNDPALAGVIRRNAVQALEQWFEAGQLAAMPTLINAPRQEKAVPTPVPALSTAARLRIAADLLDAAERAGADQSVEQIVSAKFGGITVQVSSAVAAEARLALVAVYCEVLGVRPVSEPNADGYWLRAIGQFQGCPVEAWAPIET